MPGVNVAVTASAPRLLFNRISLLIILFLALVTAVLLVYYQPQTKMYGAVLDLPLQRYVLEIADTPAEREQGLSDRESLSANQGMLFVFDRPAKYCFWMKDTLVPLDIIWLDTDNTVVHIQRNATPDSYPEHFCPKLSAKAVIELPAGAAKANNVVVGQQLRY